MIDGIERPGHVFIEQKSEFEFLSVWSNVFCVFQEILVIKSLKSINNSLEKVWQCKFSSLSTSKEPENMAGQETFFLQTKPLKQKLKPLPVLLVSFKVFL